ncbi:hypothetical protein [Bosea sp. MMO-172]|uniref:hypothetical protein n=1 Tax=Bosea sp. MMO-172 TaxID=3127885 RepID=UPI00301598E1
MLSIPNRAAVCFFGFALSGCMQSMPTAETITRPTMEAFTRLGSWTPWRSSPDQPRPVVVAAQDPAPVAEPVKERPAVQPQARPMPRPEPQLASSRARPVPPIAAPIAVPAAAVTPVAAPAPAADAASPPLLPAKVACQTASQPGGRVRMECTPVE